MKKVLRILLGMFVVCMMLRVYDTDAYGATVKTLKAGETVYGTDWGETRYKIVIPSDGMITVTSNDSWLYLSTSPNSSNYYTYFSGSESKAASKGTYYFYGLGKGYKLKYTFTKAVNQSNYSVAKAISLAAGKNVTVVQTKKYNYYRWYKISLKKKKLITFWTNNSSAVTLYDSKFNKLTTAEASGNKYYTYSKQKAGTYYVRVGDYWDIRELDESLITFKWK